MSKNLFENIPDTLPEEFMETLHKSDSVTIERIVSRGHSSPEGFWYCDDRAEFVLLLSGGAVIEFEDKEEILQPGDYILIPSRCKHRVSETSEKTNSVWLAVYL